MPRRRAVDHPSPPPAEYTPVHIPPPPDPPHPARTNRVTRRSERREIALDKPEGLEYVMWGEQWNSGKLQYSFSNNQTVVWFVYELSAGADSLGGECDGFIDCSLADGRPWPGINYIETWWYPGLAAGQLCPNLAADDPTWNETFPGTCYGVVRLAGWGRYWTERPNIVWHYRAKKCLIAETGAFVYSLSALDQFYSYMRFERGKGLQAGQISTQDWIDAKAADTAAGRVYQSHLQVMSDDANPDDVIEACRLLTDSWCYPDASGVYRLIADRPGAPSVTITEGDRSKSVPTQGGHPNNVRERPNKVTGWFTDVANGRKSVPKTVVTPGLAAGTEAEVPVEYKIPHIYDPAILDARLAYVLNSYQLIHRIEERWNAKVEEIPLGTIVDRFLEKRGDRHYTARLMGRTMNVNNTSDVHLLYHDNAKFDAAIIAVPPKIPSTLPDRQQAPTNVALAGLAWAEELYQEQGLAWRTRGLLTVTAPVDFPYVESFDVHVSVNGGASRFWFSAIAGQNTTPVLTETGTYTLTIKTRSAITGEVSIGTVFPVLVNGVTGAPPEVTEMACNFYSQPTVLSFAMPKVRIDALYGAAFWTQQNLTGFSAAAVNNGVTNVIVANEVKPPAWSVDYSDTSATGPWINAPAQGGVLTHVDMGGGIDRETKAWAAPGAHRWWSVGGMGGSGTGRIVFDAGVGLTKTFRELYIYINAAGKVTELQFREYGADVQGVKRAHVWKIIDGVRVRAFPPIPVGAFPTPAAALDVTSLISITNGEWADSTSVSLHIAVTVEMANGNQSAGETFSIGFSAQGANTEPPEFVPQYRQDVFPTPGVNSDVMMPGGCGLVHVVDPAAPFSFGGFLNFTMRPGMVLLVSYLGTQPLTVLHEDASSTAAARINTQTGANITLVGPCQILFVYDDVAARWQLMSARDRTVTFLGGKMGLGTTSPDTLLHLFVNGGEALKLGTSAGYSRLKFASPNSVGAVGGVVNRESQADIYFGEDADAGIWIFRGANGLKISSAGTAIKWHKSATQAWTPGLIVAGAFAQVVVAITGAAVGDTALAAFSNAVSVAGLFIHAEVTAANQVTATVYNFTGGGFNPGAGTVRVDVWKH